MHRFFVYSQFLGYQGRKAEWNKRIEKLLSRERLLFAKLVGNVYTRFPVGSRCGAVLKGRAKGARGSRSAQGCFMARMVGSLWVKGIRILGGVGVGVCVICV